MTDRPTWDQVWFNVADDISLRSSCKRTKVGAVIVDWTNRIVATGYNGPPAGLNQTCVTCPRNMSGERGVGYDNCIAIHAEANALLFCDRRDREGGTIYVPIPPCWECSRLIANSGLSRVAIRSRSAKDQHRDPDECLSFLRASGLEVDVAQPGA